MSDVGTDEFPEGTIMLGPEVGYTKVVDNTGQWIAIHHYHRRPDNNRLCAGYVRFKVPTDGHTGRGPLWDVISYEPFHIEPSLLCRSCNHHGFIRNGSWVPA